MTEILAKKRRLRRHGRERLLTGRFFTAHDRVRRIVDGVELVHALPRDRVDARRELLRYTCIGLVATIEGYYRSVIRDLIEHGEPYRANAEQLDDARLDVRTALRMTPARVSVVI